MVSYAAGSRYLSLIGGVCMSFYDWYCDLPPASPQVWGEQTDVPESADWYNSSFIIAWGSNVPQTRTPGRALLHRGALQGHQDGGGHARLLRSRQAVRHLDAPQAGHRRRGGDGDGPRDPEGVLLPRQGRAQRLLRRLRAPLHRPADAGDAEGTHAARAARSSWCPTATCAPPTSTASSARPTTRSGRPSPSTRAGKVVLPQRRDRLPLGPGRPRRRRASGTWRPRKRATATRSSCKLSVLEGDDAEHRHRARSASRISAASSASTSRTTRRADVLVRTVPVQRIALGKDGEKREALVATVFDLQVANYGVARGLPGETGRARASTTTRPTPRPGRSASPARRATQLITVARQFADNADKTQGKSMVIIGAAMNHWYHSDMNYRGVINMLMMCGCIGKSGGGWAHYVGQEKLRPQTGWTALAFALDWIRPPRQMNSTSFFYAHTDQWRYEKLGMDEVLSPLADKKLYGGSMIDYNVRAERMGWLPSAPQLQTNPMQVVRDAAGRRHGPEGLRGQGAARTARCKMSCDDPDHPDNWPRNMFVWRSNLLGSSRQGPRVLPQAPARHQQRRAGQGPRRRRSQARGSGLARQGARRQARPAGDARLPHEHHLPVFATSCCPPPPGTRRTTSTPATCTRSSTRCRPRWTRPGSRAATGTSTRASRKKFSEVCVGHLGVERELVLTPLMHDTPGELAQPFDVKDWKRGECELIPGKTAPNMRGGRARLPERLQALHRARPADEQGRQRRQGHRLEHADRGQAARRTERPRHAPKA